MAGGFWEKNAAVLRARYPGLAEQLEKISCPSDAADGGPAGEDIRIQETMSGNPTLVINGVHIHSNRDPEKESARQAAALTAGLAENAGNAAFVVLGFGLGYGAEAAAAASALPVIVAERRPELFRLALESRDLADFLSPGKHILVIGGKSGGVAGALGVLEQAGAGEKILVMRNRALSADGKDREWYDDAEKRIQIRSSRDSVNSATLRRFGKRWTKNLAANLGAVRDLPGIRGLSGCLGNTGIPVFLAAAGPSLDETAGYAAAIRERCVVVAVDTSLRFLLSNGAVPDFTVAVDPQYWNARHLYRLGAHCCLVAESAVYPPVLRDLSAVREPGSAGGAFRRGFLCQSLFPLGRFIEDRTDPKGALGAGGSVATTAWDFARLLSPSTLWIAGLDLGFPGLKTHFKGAAFEETVHAGSTRFNPAETSSQRSLESGFPFPASSASGGSVLTDRRLSIYGAWFENRIRQERIQSRSLSENGLFVQGLASSDIKELLALPPRRREIDRILEETFRRIENEFAAPGEKAAREKRYTQAFGSLVRGLETLLEEAGRAGKIAAGAGREPERPAGDTLVRLDKADKAIAANPVKDAAGFLFPPAGELEERLTETDPWKRHLEFSRLLYGELARSVQYTLATLKKAGNTG
ncbi:MAG: DUF115 domain-containing protein [Treponema sp.]|jgi:hypothetical protein|nr:DUF115 domain-containing protein [Treponema sp.]